MWIPGCGLPHPGILQDKHAFLAQVEEQAPFKCEVVGSSPMEGMKNGV